MQSKNCALCGNEFFKRRTDSQYYWDNKKIYCSSMCSNKSKVGKATRTTHGMRNTRIYNIWCHMKARCDRKTSEKYYCYGGRGITYCNKWKTFQGFYEDMKYGYDDTLSIDRIDVDGNYCKENCKWSTSYEQSINKRNSRFLTHNGRTQTLAQWAKELGVSHSTILMRIKRGKTISEALSY